MSELRTSETDCGLWPTPTVCGNYNRKGASATSGDGLATAVAKYQTPVARMWKDNGLSPGELARNSPTLASQAGGPLNPTWVEWLMGWPLGWTDLKPSATVKSHSARQQPSANLLPLLAEEAA
jgi:DNA (cytosine-5)-methyltransferase 1